MATLVTIRNKVKRRYERNDVSNDVSNARIDDFINDSLREIYNTLGDNAWFLRVMESVTVNQAPTVTTLPAASRRLYRLEDPAYPGDAIPWTMMGYDSDNNLQILARYGGTLTAHYRIIPPEMTDDSDVAYLPDEHVEVAVMLACKRLAESVGNASMSSYYLGESSMLLRELKRDCLRYERQRMESLTTVPSYDSWTRGWRD